MNMKNLALLMISTALLYGCSSKDDISDYEIGTWQGFRTSAVSLTFDDACQNQIDIAIPMLDEFDFKGTFYPVVTWVTDWAPWCKCAANGHEVSSHTYNHPNLSEISADSLNAELSRAIDTLRANVPMADCSTLAYPFCSTPDVSIVSKYHIAARICDGRIEPASPADYYNLSSFCVGSETNDINAIDLIGLFSRAMNEKGWCTILFHEFDNGPGYSPFASEDFRKVLEYLSDNDSEYWVAPFAHVAKYTKERDKAVIKSHSQSDSDQIELSIDCGLDAQVYNVPLSVRRALPAGWTKAEAEQNGRDCNMYINDGYMYFDVMPNGETVVLKKR